MLSEKKQLALKDHMTELGIVESKIEESYTFGSGKGGQKVNKTANAVVLKYEDLRVKCHKTRFLTLNRYYARVALCEALSKKLGFKNLKEEKIRKQKKRRKRRAKKIEIY